MTKRLTFAVAAEEELLAAARWSDRERTGVGDRLLAAARDAFRRIEAHPHLASHVPGVAEAVGARRVLVWKFPYQVVFLDLGAELRVLALTRGPPPAVRLRVHPGRSREAGGLSTTVGSG